MDNFIDINSTWFQSPIICAPEGPEKMGYKFGTCPVSEKTGINIINLPCAVPEGWESKVTEVFRKALHGKY